MRIVANFGIALGVGLLATAAAAIAQAPPEEVLIEGVPEVVDGDTLDIGGRRVLLHAVDAPELTQSCQRAGRAWRCGIEATYALANLIEHHWVLCRGAAGPVERSVVAVCRMGGPKGIEINEEIVRRGWALATSGADRRYVAAQEQARAAKLGVWSGTIVLPWQWRGTHGSAEADD